MMSEQDELGKRCAHLIYHSDNADKLREILLEVGDPLAVLTFPSSTIPNSDRTFLMACARRGRYECCKLLLSLDSASSINHQNNQGYTALHYASYEGHADVAFLLLAAGASTELRNSHNETAYETAISGKRVDLVRMYQQSQYFASYLSAPQFVPADHRTTSPPECSDANTGTVPSSSSKGTNRHEAAFFLMHITEVGPGADQSLVGCEFACLSSAQQQANKAAPTVISGSVYDAAGRIDGSSEDLYIGRARTNHVCLSDLSISKQHAVISYVEDRGFVVRDIGSKHGTFVDDKRLPAELTVPAMGADDKGGSGTGGSAAECGRVASTERVSLKEGMVVRFGRITCTVVRRRQEAVLNGRFQPVTQTSTSAAAATAQDTARRHEAAVHERVRVLLNFPESVVIPRPASMPTNGGTAHPGPNKKDASVRKRPAADNSSNIASLLAGTVIVAGHDSGRAAKTAKITHEIGERITDRRDVGQPLQDEVGRKLLEKYGWQQGVALGKHGGAANAPIEAHKKPDNAGIGACRAAEGQEWVAQEGVDSEKMKAWKRMMARYNQQR